MPRDLPADAPHDPLSISHWCHEDQQLAMQESWWLSFNENKTCGVGYYARYYYDAQQVYDMIRRKAEQGSPLHIKARRFLAAQKVKDAAAGKL